jgi:hypothetical protein
MFIFMLLLVGTLGDISLKGTPKPARLMAESLLSQPAAEAPEEKPLH